MQDTVSYTVHSFLLTGRNEKEYRQPFRLQNQPMYYMWFVKKKKKKKSLNYRNTLFEKMNGTQLCISNNVIVVVVTLQEKASPQKPDFRCFKFLHWSRFLWYVFLFLPETQATDRETYWDIWWSDVRKVDICGRWSLPSPHTTVLVSASGWLGTTHQLAAWPVAYRPVT